MTTSKRRTQRLALAMTPLLVALVGCSTSQAEAGASSSTSVVAVGHRAPPDLVATTVPELAHFLRQSDGSAIAVIDESSVEGAALFEYAEATLTDVAVTRLDELLVDIRKLNPERIWVDGYADGVGRDDWNLTLSQRRADAVAAWLRAAGVEGEIVAVGHGEAGAIDDVADPERRRVEITLEGFDNG